VVCCTISSRRSIVASGHLEAGIAYWHTQKSDTEEKWENILQLYNHLLILQYSPIAALNRTFALAKVRGKQIAIIEAGKSGLDKNPFYHSLLGNLYTGIDKIKAVASYKKTLELTTSAADRQTINKHLAQLM
jgi:predicted RNA polymerase sigma factor